jgi:hypothetical protein
MRNNNGSLWRTTSIGATAVLAAVAVGSCGGGSGSSKPASTILAAATTTTVALGTGPSTATLTIGGDKALAGRLTSTSIRCAIPSLTGPQITVLASSVDPKAQTFIIVSRDGVQVRVASGSGTSYLQREFEGKGVGTFDAARGAHLNTPLREPNAAAGNANALPAATSLKGTIDCGGQRSGSSTIVLRGNTAKGPISGTLSSVHVSCTTYSGGKYVTAVGIAKVGTQRAVVFVDGQPKGLMVYIEPAGTTALVYKSSASSAATTTARGMHVAGDAVEQRVSGRPPRTLHVSGDAVCGTTG